MIYRSLTKVLLAVILSLGISSCEDTNSSQVEIKVLPTVPSVGDYDFPTEDETIKHNWFQYSLYFNNPSSERLIISTVEASYRFGSHTSYSAATTITPHSSQNAEYFIDIDAGSAGSEYQFLDSVNTAFARYLGGLTSNGEDFNYMVKMVFTGYFTADAISTTPLPTKSFSKTIYFRTKSAKD